jgi:hypothetical protein
MKKTSRYFGNTQSGALTFDYQRENIRGNFLRADAVSREEFLKILMGQEPPKITLSDLSKQVTNITTSMVPDDNDVQWLNEFNRRLAAGEDEEDILINPPLGRQQRMVEQQLSVNEISLQLQTAVTMAGQDSEKLGQLLNQIGNLVLQLGTSNDTKHKQLLDRVLKLANEINIGSYATINLTSAPEFFGKRFLPSDVVLANQSLIASYLAHMGPLQGRPVSHSVQVYNKATNSYNLQPISIISNIKELEKEIGEEMLLDLKIHSIEAFSTLSKLGFFGTASTSPTTTPTPASDDDAKKKKPSDSVKDETKKVIDSMSSAYTAIPTSSSAMQETEEPIIEYFSSSEDEIPPPPPPREEKKEEEDLIFPPTYVSPNKRKPLGKSSALTKQARSRSKSVTRKKISTKTKKKKNKTKKKK